ncbi:glycosyltransferase family 25 protein [Paracoccus sp. APAP_BH8]|uniref:Glycosyltransferase family 25 protein n=1 Tax=Paracoccus pantotrophus TaxID=82367 RepID=A0A7H9BY08_PARPN|nr:glycosyltransferase family 25 protein [Paracoccus pantotrophus]QLH16294.1 glycosyltransferase family 25 protein [Paracoccus pantotrophus]
MRADWPIFILTLEGDEARRQPLLDQLAGMGLQWRLIYGVDGRRGLPAEYLSMIDRDAAHDRLKRPMTDSEFACALSHRQIYETIMDEGLDGALVLEDDAILTPDFPDFIRAGHHLTDTLALLYHYSGRALPWQRKKAGRWLMYRPTRRASGCTGYTLSRNTAHELLQATTPVSFVSDWPVDLYHSRAWLVSPRVVHHAPPGQGLSHLAGERTAAEMQRPREKKNPARFLKASYYRGLVRRRLARRVDS